MGQNIKIKIAGNEYPLVASSPEMERMMRLAADAINQKLAAYDAKYPNKTLSDKLSFVALNEAVGRLAYQKRVADADAEAKKLQEDVESYIKNIEKDGRYSHVLKSTSSTEPSLLEPAMTDQGYLRGLRLCA